LGGVSYLWLTAAGIERKERTAGDEGAIRQMGCYCAAKIRQDQEQAGPPGGSDAAHSRGLQMVDATGG